jgi:hypothetical protein
MALPASSYGDYYYYGVYIDPQDGKWFHGAYGVYYLNPENTAWTRYSQSEVPQLPDNYVEGVLADDGGNVWFMCRYGIVLMKKDPAGGAPAWFRFAYGDGTGYTGGYRVYQDDSGQVWNAAKQKFDPQNNLWVTVADTSAFDHRHLRFANGRVPADMGLAGALSPISALDERNMTLDSRGTIFFSGWLGNVTAGIVALGPPAGGTLAVTAHATGAGAGSVSSAPAGISYHYNTAISGTAGFSQGAAVALTATAEIGSTASWNDCFANGGVAGGTGVAATCSFSSLNGAKSVTASFDLKQYQLSVTLAGTGGGSVNSSPAGIACTGATCHSSFGSGTQVLLSQAPDSNSTFTSWSGACVTSPCAITMDSDKLVTATFTSLPLAQIGSAGYESLSTAFADAYKGPILARAVVFDESPDVTLATTLNGGYNSSFSSATGYSVILGTLTISTGKLTLERVAIK